MERTKQSPAFRKMKVTGPRSAEMLVADVMADANPTAKAIVESNQEMAAALKEGAAGAKSKAATRSKTRKRRRIAPSSAVAIYDACLQRLRALKSQFDQSYDPLVRLLAQQEARAPAPAQATVLQEAPAQVEAPAAAVEVPAAPAAVTPKAIDESSAVSNTMQARVLEALPEQYHRKYTALSNYLKANSDLIRVSPSGRILIGGSEVAGSSFVDTMRALYMWRKQGVPLPRGTREVISTLQSIGVPATLLSSSAARDMYQELLEEEEGGYESPSEEPPAPPPPSDTAKKIPSTTASTSTSNIQKGKGVAAVKWPGTAPEVLYLYKP